MQTLNALVLLFLFATAAIAFGHDRGGDYARKAGDDDSDLAVRLARLDLVSYLLTSVPLVGGLMILLSSDPMFGALVFPSGWRDGVSAALGLIASLGVGLGIARRQWALIALKRRLSGKAAS